MIKKVLLFFFALSSFFIVLGGGDVETASAKICGIGEASQYNGSDFTCKSGSMKNENTSKVTSYFKYAAAAIAGIALGIAVLTTVYAGYLYTISEGNPETVEKAKKTIMAAGIAMMFSSLSFVIFAAIKSILGV